LKFEIVILLFTIKKPGWHIKDFRIVKR
jgi:hypothetical protein